MATLYKNQDPFIQALIRVVEGQVRSYGVDHPEVGLSERNARGITKRVVGNIASDWARLAEVRATGECEAPREEVARTK